MLRLSMCPATRVTVTLKVRSKFWVEQAGELVLSDWRIDLLEAIEATGSLAAASTRLNVPYRVAWGKIKQIERRLGYRLIKGQTGGPSGGSTQLTPEGNDLLIRYRRFQAGLPELIQRRFDEEFGLYEPEPS
jgi:molybdate transport system regulatory protein